ncbi:hypothetical protein [Rhodococcus sp. IEGM 1408]|uniref:hypothetical protein n=1 Tax=Rhodococcus sp. IEGM 1408 TaxID=3082220 RepID=UPI0029533557|nr:hypothetical protein [Rhodococcus sp. IEGM 1408]MDV8001338.1 hypothetical protein [Rhodococcus sp. IEGM 1408]
MFQRRSHRSAPRTRSLALGGALAALAVVGGGTVAVVSAPAEVVAGDILLAQNTGAQEMELGAPVNLDLEPVVARAAGGAVPAGTTVQVTGLPDGLTQNGWVISGTPSHAGDYDVLVTVSNAGVSQSQKVTITVTDELSPAAAPTTTSAPSAARGAATAGADGESGADGTTTSPSATTSPSTTAAQAVPTLSAAPGDPALDGAPAGDDAGEATEGDDEPGTSPDLCAVLGDGGTDAASLASGLVPMLTGGDESASSGLVMMLVNAIVGMLPSLLGESGSTEDLGSAGQLLCTISPALLGGAPADQAGGAATGGDTTAGADLGGAPAALLGMLTTGAGSLGG